MWSVISLSCSPVVLSSFFCCCRPSRRSNSNFLGSLFSHTALVPVRENNFLKKSERPGRRNKGSALCAHTHTQTITEQTQCCTVPCARVTWPDYSLEEREEREVVLKWNMKNLKIKSFELPRAWNWCCSRRHYDIWCFSWEEGGSDHVIWNCSTPRSKL